jgi:hypothetical protein
MFAESAMTNLTSLWVRVALLSAIAVAASPASAQTGPVESGAAVSGRATQSTAAKPAASESSTAQSLELQPTKEQCVNSHRQAQQAQLDGSLVHARELARTCTALSCPALVIGDCARWLNELEQRIPSVVFEVRLDGQPNLMATIDADGNKVTEWTRGESLRLDPGEHQFRFGLPPFQPIVQSVFLAEGMRYRVVSAEFKTPTDAASAAAAPGAPARPQGAQPLLPAQTKVRPTPVIVYPLLGIGAVGIASFVVFGLTGNSKQNDLENSCKPNCQDSDLNSMKKAYLVGDISLGVGAASLIAASVIYLTRPEKPLTTTVGFAPLPGGATAVGSYRF